MANEERAVYVVLICVGLLPLLGSILDGGNLGGGATIATLMIVLGLFGFGGAFNQTLPKATLRRPRR